MTILDVPEDHLFDAPRNPNRMEPEVYERLVASIKRFGFWMPVLVRDVRLDKDGKHTDDPKMPFVLEVVDGHHRLRAGREAGLKKIPCVNVTGLSDDEIEMLRLGLNRLRGDPDLAIVADVFKDLSDHGFDATGLEVTGFSSVEITDLLESLTRGEQDDMLAPQEPVREEDDKPRPFTLEIEFASKEQYQLCRRKLRKAAGKGNGLDVGLLRVLGEEGP